MNFNPENYLIFECITGSKLYGTDTPDSDFDYRVICIPPLPVLLDPFMNFEQKDSGFEEEDRTIYALGKFMKLCADCNPNIVELLFIPECNIIQKSGVWNNIIENKQLFLSKKVKHTFLGYSFSQLKAIKNHRQWFINAPKEKPKRKDFGLTDNPILSGENLENCFNVPSELFKPEYHEEFVKEREYRLAKRKWDNYVSWRDNRNPARKETEDKWGYDAKYASHVFRLLSEGKELLLTGNITFPLPNCEEIKDIKNGKYSYEEMLLMAENMEKEFEFWYNQSTLPKAPDRNKLTRLYLDVLSEYQERIRT